MRSTVCKASTNCNSQSILSGLRLPYDELSPAPESSESSESSDDEQYDYKSLGTAAEPSGQVVARTELQQIQDSISSFIRNLYQISIIVRKNPVPHDRLVKSAKIDTSFYEYWDVRHIEEKYSQANPKLCTRLGKANSRRRQYFKYREQHRQKLSVEDGGLPPTHSKHSDAEIPRDTIVPEGTKPPTTTIESTAASTFFVDPFQSQLNLEIVNQHSETGTQTTYESASSVVQEHLRIPDPPKPSPGMTEFECPYCYTIYRFRSGETWRRKKEWKQHVLRDLQPYICTFGDCPQASTLYERRGDWMHHEVQYHRKEWSCNAIGHNIYNSRDKFIAHMACEHRESVNAFQGNRLIDMLERPATSSRFACPLCRDERYMDLDLGRLERHLGRHLQILATFSLPSLGSGGHESNDSRVAQESNDSRVARSQDTSQRKSESNPCPSDSGVEADASSTHDNYLDKTHGLLNPEFAHDDSVPAHKDSLLNGNFIFESAVLDQQVSSHYAVRCLRDWNDTHIDSMLGLDQGRQALRVTSKLKALASQKRLMDYAENTANVSLRQLFEVVLEIAGEALEGVEGLPRGSVQFNESLRSCLSGFTDLMIEHLKMRKEEVDISGSLVLLQQQLMLPQPSEVPASSEGDWKLKGASVPSQIPSDLSCLIRFEPLSPNYAKQGRRTGSDGNNFWVPPNKKDAYHRNRSGARFFRWKGGRATEIPNDSYSNAQLRTYGVATVFGQYRDTPHLLAVGFDAETKDVAEEPGGDLPILFGLVALSAPPHLLSNVITTCMQPNAWIPHKYPHSRDTESGMVVTVYFDPSNEQSSNKKLLDMLQQGHFGPFYRS
ncbi:MAG: hypothetical protein Q9208_000201 [Pyrenodesmia sp. 3 TL-2023]